MQKKKVQVKLNFHLTPDEIEEKAQIATQLMTLLDNKEEEFKIIKRDWNKEIKDIRLKVRKMCQTFATKMEERDVQAEVVYDLNSGQMWFDFDGKQYQERSITEEERAMLQQGTIFDDDANIPWTSTAD